MHTNTILLVAAGVLVASRAGLFSRAGGGGGSTGGGGTGGGGTGGGGGSTSGGNNAPSKPDPLGGGVPSGLGGLFSGLASFGASLGKALASDLGTAGGGPQVAGGSTGDLSSGWNGFGQDTFQLDYAAAEQSAWDSLGLGTTESDLTQYLASELPSGGQLQLDPGLYSPGELNNYQLSMGDPMAGLDTGSF